MNTHLNYVSTNTPANFTTSVSAERHLLYSLRSDDDLEENYQEALIQLSKITINFSPSQDKLSKHLHKWATNWENIAPKFDFEIDDNIDYTEEESIALADAAMYRLSADIGKQFGVLRILLRNHLTFEPSIVSDPMYDEREDKLWEAADYHTFRHISAPLCLSPYTKMPFKAKEHP